MLNWLFFMPTGGQRVAQDANPWQEYWGESYGPQLKRALLKPLFEWLESEEKIGKLIVDIGSGALPVTRLLETKPGKTGLCRYRC